MAIQIPESQHAFVVIFSVFCYLLLVLVVFIRVIIWNFMVCEYTESGQSSVAKQNKPRQ